MRLGFSEHLSHWALEDGEWLGHGVIVDVLRRLLDFGLAGLRPAAIHAFTRIQTVLHVSQDKNGQF